MAPDARVVRRGGGVEHDVDVVSPTFDRLLVAVGTTETTLASTDPFEATVEFRIGEDRIRATVDADLAATFQRDESAP